MFNVGSSAAIPGFRVREAEAIPGFRVQETDRTGNFFGVPLEADRIYQQFAPSGPRRHRGPNRPHFLTIFERPLIARGLLLIATIVALAGMS